MGFGFQPRNWVFFLNTIADLPYPHKGFENALQRIADYLTKMGGQVRI